MKRLFRKKEGGSHDFWMSYTDMMSAFLIVFMIGCISLLSTKKWTGLKIK